MHRWLFCCFLSAAFLNLAGCPGQGLENPPDDAPQDKPKDDPPKPQMDAGSDTPEPETDAGNETPEPVIDAGSDTPEPETDAGNETPEPEMDAGSDTPEPETDAGNETPEPEMDAGSDTPEPEADAGNETPEPEMDAGNETPEPEMDAGSDTPETETDAGNETTEPQVDAGNETPAPETDAGNTVVADTTPPETSLDSHPEALTNNPQATFAFSANESPATFQCSLNGASPATCTSPHSLTLSNDGEHSFSVYAVDEAGNADATPESFTWTLDTTAPTTIIDSAPDALTNQTEAVFEFYSNDGEATYECQLDNADFLPCTSPKAYTLTQDGPHFFTVRATDALGNVESNGAGFIWDLDTAAPVTTVLTGPEPISASVDTTITFEADDSVAIFYCRFNSDPFEICTSPHVFTGHAEGTHVFEIYATDALGNQESPSVLWAFEISMCGNLVIDAGEACDGPQDCVAIDANRFSAGAALCSDDCTSQSLDTCSIQLFSGEEEPSIAILNDIYFRDNMHSPMDIGDIDADGDLDVIVGYNRNFHDPLLRIFLNDGAANFTASSEDFSLDFSSSALSEVALIDVDQDELLDIMVYVKGYSTDYSAWLRNTENGDFDEVTYQNENYNGNFGVFDINGDNRMDMVGTNPLHWMANNWNDEFPTTTVFSAADHHHVLCYDYDRDTDLDCFGSKDYSSAERVYVYTNTGESTFETAYGNRDYVFILLKVVHQFFFADITGDNWPDLVVIDLEGVHWYPIDAQGFVFKNADTNHAVKNTIMEFPHSTNSSWNGGGRAAVADLDDDGDSDLVVAIKGTHYNDFQNGELIWLENDGRGDFESRFITNQINDNTDIKVGDFDSDNDLDIIYLSESNEQLGWFKNLLYDCEPGFTGGVTPGACNACMSNNANLPDCTTCNAGWSGAYCNVPPPTPTTTLIDTPPTHTPDDTAEFTFSSDDATATFECRINNDDFASCTSPHSVTILVDSFNTFEVRATSALGRTETIPAFFTWTRDNIAPQTSNLTGPESIHHETSVSFDFEATEDHVSFFCRMNTDAFEPCNTPHTVTELTEGNYTFEIYAVDAAGNTEATPKQLSFEIDFCGNGILDAEEFCDAPMECTTIDNDQYIGGNATCNASCAGYDVESCQLRVFGLAPVYIDTDERRYTALLAADINDDGYTDIVVNSSAGSGTELGLEWYENNSGEGYTKHEIPPLYNSSVSEVFVTAIDFDGDGDKDIITRGYGFYDHLLFWHKNNGQNDFTTQSYSFFQTQENLRSADIADLDRDGDWDIITSGDLKYVAWHENDGNENFTSHIIENELWEINAAHPVDLDEDGHQDLVVTTRENDIFWYKHDGFGGFSKNDIKTVTQDGNTKLAIADVDKDGDLDIVTGTHISSGGSTQIAWLENDGSENFTANNLNTPFQAYVSVYAMDLDADNDIDIIAAPRSNGEQAIYWYENDGTQNFELGTIIEDYYVLSAADMDNDGDKDIVFSTEFDWPTQQIGIINNQRFDCEWGFTGTDCDRCTFSNHVAEGDCPIAPHTFLLTAPEFSSTDNEPVFTFVGNTDDATFECRIDEGDYLPCISPFQTSPLSVGSHRVNIRSISAEGFEDTTPTVSIFWVEENTNECELQTDNCHALATCTDTEDSFECDCLPGYSGDGVSCEDIDECDTGEHDCVHPNACENTTGSFQCVCAEGYTEQPEHTPCADIDECALIAADVTGETLTDFSPEEIIPCYDAPRMNRCPDNAVAIGLHADWYVFAKNLELLCQGFDENGALNDNTQNTAAMGDPSTSSGEVLCPAGQVAVAASLEMSFGSHYYRIGRMRLDCAPISEVLSANANPTLTPTDWAPTYSIHDTEHSHTCPAGAVITGIDGQIPQLNSDHVANIRVACRPLQQRSMPLHDCDASTTCVNEPGGYTCQSD